MTTKEKRVQVGTCDAKVGEWSGWRCGRPAFDMRPASNWDKREIRVCGIHKRARSVWRYGR